MTVGASERLGVVVSQVMSLDAALGLNAQRNILIEAEARLRRTHGFCDGCNGPISRCGPALWKEQRKCCPDCTHGAEHE